jgi:hypothetical protein
VAPAGRCDKALASYEKALAIVPDDKAALAGVEACDPRAKRVVDAAAEK